MSDDVETEKSSQILRIEISLPYYSRSRLFELFVEQSVEKVLHFNERAFLPKDLQIEERHVLVVARERICLPLGAKRLELLRSNALVARLRLELSLDCWRLLLSCWTPSEINQCEEEFRERHWVDSVGSVVSGMVD